MAGCKPSEGDFARGEGRGPEPAGAGMTAGPGGSGTETDHPLSRRERGSGVRGRGERYSAGAAVSSYRLSFLYKVEGSIPRTSAARVLFPPSACSTHMM